MELHLRINDVLGKDDNGCHILYVDDESVTKALLQKNGWLESLLKTYLLKHNTRVLSSIIDDPTLRNTIYMQEKVRRDKAKEELDILKQREERNRREKEQRRFEAIREGSVEYLHEILGWNK